MQWVVGKQIFTLIFRYDRSQSDNRYNRRGRPQFNMPMDPYNAPPPAPAPHPGYGMPPHPPALDMGAQNRGYKPRPAVIDATGSSNDTARHAK